MTFKTWRKGTLEPWLHEQMGKFGMEAFVEREIRQLPPENDRYPARAVARDMTSPALLASQMTEDAGWDEYWAKPRVIDTLTDIRDAAKGFDRSRRNYFLATLPIIALAFAGGFIVGRLG